MDRVGASPKKRHSVWVLGMQRDWFAIDSALLCHLSARFGRDTADGIAAADLSTQSLLSLHPSSRQTSRCRTAGRRVSNNASNRRLTLILGDAKAAQQRRQRFRSDSDE